MTQAERDSALYNLMLVEWSDRTYREDELREHLGALTAPQLRALGAGVGVLADIIRSILEKGGDA